MTDTMTPDQAIQILAQATQPQMIGQITREGYVQIQHALDVCVQMREEGEMLRKRVQEMDVARKGPAAIGES